jgi:adenylate kinase family enzyme
MIPKNEPVTRKATDRVKVFIFGQPMSGKTTFAATFPSPLILSTDGNFKHTKVPAISIKEENVEKNVNGKISYVKKTP